MFFFRFAKKKKRDMEENKLSQITCPIQKEKLEYYPKDRFNISQPVDLKSKLVVCFYKWLRIKNRNFDYLVLQEILEFIPLCKCLCHKMKCFGVCNFARFCDNPNHLFCQCELIAAITAPALCTSVVLHDKLLYNDYQFQHMPEKWLKKGTTEVQKHFQLHPTFQTTSAPHELAISDYKPNTCNETHIFSGPNCVICKRKCCVWQLCDYCHAFLHAECGLFSKLGGMVGIYCKDCVVYCFKCKKYFLGDGRSWLSSPEVCHDCLKTD